MEFNNGYIKLSRNILKNEFLMDDDKAFHTFIKILLTLDYKTGTLKTGRKKLAALTRYKENTVYKVIKRLEKEGMIEINSSKTDTTIFVPNWKKYQNFDNFEEQRSNNAGNKYSNNVDNNPENNKSIKNNNKSNNKKTTRVLAGNTIQEKRNINNIKAPTLEVEQSSKKKYGNEDVRLTKKLFELMKRNHDHITKNPKESDFIEIRRINSIDKKSYETIEWIIEWSQQHDFWKSKILSTGKLRKQMDQLMVQAKDERAKMKKSYSIPRSTPTKKNDPMIQEKELSPEQKERGKLMKDLMAAGYKMSEVVNLRSKSNEELKKLLGDKIK